MKNQIIPLGEENRKVFGFSDEQIIFSSKKHKTFESLLAATGKSGMLETVKIIPVAAVKEIIFNEKEENFTIKYNQNGKIKKDAVQLKNTDLRTAVVDELASLKDFSKSVVEESRTKPLLLNLLGVICIPIFTWIFRGMAVDAQNGEEYVATGRRSGLKNLLASAVEAIGPTGVLIIGLLGLAYMVYRTYNRYNKPASEVKYR